jgi:hypothetical protein
LGETISNGYICIEQDVSLKNYRVNRGLEILFNNKIIENRHLLMQKQCFAKVKKYTIVFSIIYVNAKTFLGQVQKIFNCLLNNTCKRWRQFSKWTWIGAPIDHKIKQIVGAKKETKLEMDARFWEGIQEAILAHYKVMKQKKRKFRWNACLTTH